MVVRTQATKPNLWRLHRVVVVMMAVSYEAPTSQNKCRIRVRHTVMSSFSVSKALFFNFPLNTGGTSKNNIGFTTGGFLYIAVAKVLVEVNNGSSSAIKSTVLQLISLISRMAVTLYALEEEIHHCCVSKSHKHPFVLPNTNPTFLLP
ncbi:hypothetical protein HYC85_023620 [Camellia sinensis]|uniref:Uncharacterized protein n=1 Tax=Camellia sinensis TaxID=4442 RepID=A0A7J7GHH3_CAMSI|nr:hypothetical protein HYC85_023620 [Camellia sinensis]